MNKEKKIYEKTEIQILINEVYIEYKTVLKNIEKKLHIFHETENMLSGLKMIMKSEEIL